MKSTVCLTDGQRAYVSQHLGDLGDLQSFRFFEETIEKLIALTGSEPTSIVHDLHPDYRSTRWAAGRGLSCLPVQHHHAHVAACLAEHGRTGPCLGVAFDGTGLGSDGGIWGGELLQADLGGFQRRGHLGALPMPGGEAAIRQPWRLAAAALWMADEPLHLLTAGPAALAPATIRPVEALLRAATLPTTSAAGRWFDAVAVLCGVGREVSYDGQAPCELEALAAAGRFAPYPFAIAGTSLEVDLRETIRAIAAELRAGRPAAVIAARFHETMARVIASLCRQGRAAGGPGLVALAGGCFANRRLAERATTLLEQDGFEVLLPGRIPAGDGGLSLGQAAIAAYQGGARCA
jgi:hydrogenase maturation protein HypF